MKTVRKRKIALPALFFLLGFLSLEVACAANLRSAFPIGSLSFALLHKSRLQVAAPGENPVVPYRGLTYTSVGIEEVRSVARDTVRGRAMATEIFASATPWLVLSDGQVRALLPPVDALFAYGTAGDPKTDQSWPVYGRSDDVCNLDRPGTVRSPYTGDLYGNAQPGEAYYDSGNGWVRPSDGKVFYFKGIWNSWIVQQLHEAVDNLALAYMLTGDETVAERGLLILDELAALKAARGEESGFIDSSSYGTTTNKYFLAYAGNGANDRIFQTALSVDLLAGSSFAFSSSKKIPNKTIFENLHDHYFALYELSYKESRHTLYNHTTALFANQIAQAVLFGRPNALAEGLDVIEVWLNQCLTRDGQYYENAGGYERVGIDYFSKMLLPLVNYSPDHYTNSAAFPDRQQYAFDMNFGDDPRWHSAALLMKYRMMALARIISFGDMWEDRLVLPGQTRGEEQLWCTYARLLYSQTTNPARREQISQGYWRLPDEVRNAASLYLIHRMGMNQWFEPETPENPLPPSPAADFLLATPSELLPGKMMALMRSGAQADARAAFLNGSVYYSHGNDDQLALLLYAKGMCLAGTYGYPSAGSPAHRGWAMKPASHWTLVVNEDLPVPSYPAKSAPPASLQGWLTEQAGLSVQMVEMSNPYLWTDRIAPDMTEYRRLLWTVDVSDEAFYFLDFFQATGGHTHDYFWTGQWLDQVDPGEGFSVQGVSPEPVEGVWSLAGFNANYSGEYYNQPGLSWGERVIPGTDGRIAFKADSSEEINVDAYWNPPPGNGYGFIYDVRREITTNNWSATWDLIDRTNTMRLTFVNAEEQQAITARSPAFTVARYHSLAIARRTGVSPLQSQFAGLVEVAAPGQWPVQEARRLDIDPAAGMGVSLSLANGSVDVLLAGASPVSDIQQEGIAFTGARGFVRKAADGRVTEMMLHEGTELLAGEYGVSLDQSAWEGGVTQVSPSDSDNQVTVDLRLPAGLLMEGQPAIFSSPPDAPLPLCLQDETYMIKEVSSDGAGGTLHFGAQCLVASRVVVDSIAADGAVQTTWPNEIRGGRYDDTGYFTGRKVVVSDDPARETRVASYPDRKIFYPVDLGVFLPGDSLEFRTVRVGDRVRIPAEASLKEAGPGRWNLNANAGVTLQLPAAPGDSLFVISSNHYEQVAETDGTQISGLIPVESLGTGSVQIVVAPALLVAQYRFDDEQDLGRDSSERGNHLSTNDGFSTPVYSADGKTGGAAYFDGSSSWITPPGIYPHGSFTIAAWVKPADTNIITVLEPSTRRGGAAIYHAADTFRFRIFNSDREYTYRVGLPSVPAEWQHLAMSYEATSGSDSNGDYNGILKVYVDGVYISGVTGEYAAPDYIEMQVGGADYGATYRGLMDDVQVYSGALSQQAIQNLMNSSNPFR